MMGYDNIVNDFVPPSWWDPDYTKIGRIVEKRDLAFVRQLFLKIKDTFLVSLLFTPTRIRVDLPQTTKTGVSMSYR
jgi:hypothetical protein